VEQIHSHRTWGQHKTLQYLIKWKGYPKSDNTWENANQVHAPTLIKLYHWANAQKAIKARQIHLERYPLPKLESHPSHSSEIPPRHTPYSPIILHDSTAALVWSTPSVDEGDNRLACSPHAPLAQSPLALRVHTMLPISCATLMVFKSTLQTSTASNDNLLYALCPLIPNSSTQCLLPPHSTPQTNHLMKLHSSHPHTITTRQLQSLSHPAPSRRPSNRSPTLPPHYSEVSPMGSYKPSLTERLPPPLRRSGTRIDSTTLNNVSSTMRTLSMSLPPATHSTTAKSPTSTSQSATGSIRRQSGFDSMRTAPSQVIMRRRDPMSSPTLSTYTHRPTSALIPPSKHCRTGSGICSPDWEVTSKSYSRLWLTQTTGAWPERLHATTNSMTTSRPSPSKLSSINVTLTPLKHSSHHVSHSSCSPVPPSRLPRYKTYLGRLEQYVWGGRGAVACHAASMFAPHRWRMNRDVRGHPS
jgi:Chromo (CHRromatin Organisation MOdifier) domain